MNCIFICVFSQDLRWLFLLLESIFIYGNLRDDTEILIYTSFSFMEKIKQHSLFCDKKIKFEINNSKFSVEDEEKSRLEFFNFSISHQYKNILCLNTDCIVKKDLRPLFQNCQSKEVMIGFLEGVLFFRNCEATQRLFQQICQDYTSHSKSCFYIDSISPYIGYMNNDIFSDRIIHSFHMDNSTERMANFLQLLKENTIFQNIETAKRYIDEHLMPIILASYEPLEGNIFMLNNEITYADSFLDKQKNISNLVLNQNVRNVMEIGFGSGFSVLLMLLSNKNLHITCFDLGCHKYTLPCFYKLKETFGDRICLILGNSNDVLPHIFDSYDLIHIDGGHEMEVAEKDINESYRLSKHGTVMIMNGYDEPLLHELWDHKIAAFELKSLDTFVYETPFHDIRVVDCLSRDVGVMGLSAKNLSIR